MKKKQQETKTTNQPLLPASVTSWQNFLFWGSFLSISFYFLYQVRSVLLPFIVGFLVAYLFTPLVDKLDRYKIPRPLASMIVITCVVGTFVAFVSFTWPYIQSEIATVVRRIPKYSIIVQTQILGWMDQASTLTSPDQWASIKDNISKYLTNTLSWFGSILISFVTSGFALANLIVLVVISPIVAFYLLRDWHKLLQSLRTFIPEGYRHVVEKQAALMDINLRGYAKGQALVSISLSTYYAVCLWAIGLDSGALIGALTGFFAFIPFLAALSGFVIASLLSIYQTPDLWLWGYVVIVFVIGQALEGSLLTPNLVGDRIGLHPVWIIFAVLSGAALFGFWGAVAALPVASILSVLSKFGLQIYYASPFHKASSCKK